MVEVGTEPRTSSSRVIYHYAPTFPYLLLGLSDLLEALGGGGISLFAAWFVSDLLEMPGGFPYNAAHNVLLNVVSYCM